MVKDVYVRKALKELIVLHLISLVYQIVCMVIHHYCGMDNMLNQPNGFDVLHTVLMLAWVFLILWPLLRSAYKQAKLANGKVVLYLLRIHYVMAIAGSIFGIGLFTVVFIKWIC